jgi:hypothetical protein
MTAASQELASMRETRYLKKYSLIAHVTPAKPPGNTHTVHMSTPKEVAALIEEVASHPQ